MTLGGPRSAPGRTRQEGSAPVSEKFVRGNDRLAKALSERDLRARVTAIREEMERADRCERSGRGAADEETKAPPI